MNDHTMEEYMSQVQNYVFVPNDNLSHSELDGNFRDNSNGNNNEGESRNLNSTESRQTELGNNYYPGTITNEAALISASNAQTQAILESHHQYHLAMQQSLFQNADQLNGLSGNPNGAIVTHSGIPGSSNLHYQHGMLQSAMPLPIPISYGVLPPTATVPIPAMAIQVSNLSHAFVNSMQQNSIIAAPGPIIHDGIPLKPRSLEEEYAIILHRSASAAAKSSNTKYRCLFCNFTFVGGPQKIRVHLTGKRENGTRLSRCENCPEDVRKRLEERMKAPKEAASETGLFDDDDHHTPSLPPRNVEEHHCIVLSRSVSSNSKSSNTRYKCIYCRFKFVGGPQKIRVHLTGHPEGGTRMTKCTRVPEEVMIQMEHRRKAPKPDILTTPVGMQVLLPPHMQDGSQHALIGPGGAVIPLNVHQQAMMKQQQQAQQLHIQQQQQLQHLQRQQQMQQIQHHQQHLQQQQHLHHLQQIHQQQLQHQHLQQQHLQMPNSQGQIHHAQHQVQQLHHPSQQALPLHMHPAQHLMHPSQLMMLQQQQQQQQQQQSYQRHMQQQAMAQQQHQQQQISQHHPYLNQQGHPAFSSVQDQDQQQQEDASGRAGQASGSAGSSAEHSYESQHQSSSSATAAGAGDTGDGAGEQTVSDPAPQEDAGGDSSNTSNANTSASTSGSTEA